MVSNSFKEAVFNTSQHFLSTTGICRCVLGFSRHLPSRLTVAHLRSRHPINCSHSPSLVARVRDTRRGGALEAAKSSMEGISEPPSTKLDGDQAGFATTTAPENDDALTKWPYDWRKQ